MEISEKLSIFGDLDLQLEPFTPICLDQCATPVFSFLSQISSPSFTTVDPVPPNEQLNPQTRSKTHLPPDFPTANTRNNNSFPFSTAYPESEDEPLRLTNTPRENVRPFASRPLHSNSQHHAKSVALYKQHQREHFASRAGVVEKPRFNRHLLYKHKPEFSSWDITYWDSTRQEFTIRIHSLPSQRNVVPLKNNYGSPTLMTLNPFAPTFRPQQRPEPNSISRPQILKAMNSSELSDYHAIGAKASTAIPCSDQIEEKIHSFGAKFNQL